ncbi:MULTISPECIES: hypothetical protein [unclassified Halomonas]|uniref:hypothetical protein n=1 Tax=unclassified Halomonas TaxID=2609666 RepID=UPI0028885F59|nr:MULTISPECIES: hypothetical protein [unclassified Halomonas]MDT0500566.1 hypothetical protein [Halomonas sp. PAR7]MDT0511538.1 hypothetical protein [Halomonas sp. LES1]MDT0590174.1 hypothetical protein [Halomonas sp. PAR8]
MSVLRLFYDYARWSGSIYRKLFSIVPWRTAGVAIFSLFSQFTLMLAFFLPLKVIILIGSTGIPKYFPPSWASLDRNSLVIMLSVSAVAFYLLHLVAERGVDIFADSGARTLVARSRKMTLFAGQEEFAKSVYQRMSRILAAGCFLVLVALFFMLFYPYLFFVLTAYLSLSLLLVSLTAELSDWVNRLLVEQTKLFIQTASGIGFLCLFVFMVADFVLWQGAEFMVAIISLLLTRQLLQKLVGALVDGVSLYQKRLKINALFFHGHALSHTAPVDSGSSVWRFLGPDIQQQKVTRFLVEEGRDTSNFAIASMTWQDQDQRGVLCFRVEVEQQVPQKKKSREHYLLKIYDSGKQGLARREKELLQSELAPAPPCLEVFALGDVLGYAAIAYRLEGAREVSSKESSEARLEFIAKCWSSRPSASTLDRYTRSHPVLAARLSEQSLERLEVIAQNGTGLADVLRLREAFQRIKGILDGLPRCLVNKSISRHALLRTRGGDVVGSDWANWALEPVGVGLPVSNSVLERLPALLERAAIANPELVDIDPQRVMLAAYMSHWERLCARQQYAQAIRLIPAMLSCLGAEEASCDDATGQPSASLLDGR